ncbi:MAG: TRAP transporter substrate-binding protein DctP [Nitrospira sp.]|nr:TRAP transporter substrate-binding protein DctP [Nitrospira sp.]
MRAAPCAEKFAVRVGLAVLGAVVALVVAGPGWAETIKLGTLAPKNSPYYDILRELGDSWTTISKGTIHLRIYSDGVAGDDPDMVRKMRIGQLDAALVAGSGLYEIAPETKAIQLPMLFQDDDEWDYVRTHIAPRLEEIYAAKGFRVLLWGDAGWVYLFAQKPVVHPDDLKPLRLFVWAGDQDNLQAWKNMGYRAVPLAVNELHSALHSGLVHAYLTTPLAALSFQWFALSKEMTDVKVVPLVGALVMAEKKWQAIPANVRERLIQASREAGTRFLKEMRKHSAEALHVMQQHGLTVHPVPPDVLTEWTKRFRANYPTIMGDNVPPDLVAEVERLRDEYRAVAKRR